MIKCREFFTELECFDGYTWDVKVTIDSKINRFLAENTDIIEVVDVKYQTNIFKNCIFSSALLIYKV